MTFVHSVGCVDVRMRRDHLGSTGLLPAVFDRQLCTDPAIPGTYAGTASAITSPRNRAAMRDNTFHLLASQHLARFADRYAEMRVLMHAQRTRRHSAPAVDTAGADKRGTWMERAISVDPVRAALSCELRARAHASGGVAPGPSSQARVRQRWLDRTQVRAGGRIRPAPGGHMFGSLPAKSHRPRSCPRR
jgi:hypothetical protein